MRYLVVVFFCFFCAIIGVRETQLLTHCLSFVQAVGSGRDGPAGQQGPGRPLHYLRVALPAQVPPLPHRYGGHHLLRWHSLEKLCRFSRSSHSFFTILRHRQRSGPDWPHPAAAAGSASMSPPAVELPSLQSAGAGGHRPGPARSGKEHTFFVALWTLSLNFVTYLLFLRYILCIL